MAPFTSSTLFEHGPTMIAKTLFTAESFPDFLFATFGSNFIGVRVFQGARSVFMAPGTAC